MATQVANASVEAFLEQHLEAITDADPKTLTPYILALIHKPKKYCTEQLRDFLHEETEPFVEKLFDFLAKRTSHRKGKEDRERKRDRGDKEGKRRRHDGAEREAKRARKEGGRHGEKAPKAAQSRVEAGVAGRDPPPPYHISEADAQQARATKQHPTGISAERGKGAEEEDFSVPLNPLENSLNALLMGTDGRTAAPNHTMGDPNQRNVQMMMPAAPRVTPGHPQMLMQPGPAGPQLHFPPGMMSMAPAPLQLPPGFAPPGMPPHFLAGPPPGHHPLMPGMPPPGMPGMPGMPGFALHSVPIGMPPQQHGLIGVPLNQGMSPHIQRPFPPSQRRDDTHHPRLSGGGGGGGEVPRNTLLVRNVPADVNTIARLSAHFERFGMVLTVRVQPANRTALVTFRSAQEANEALNSPEAVCGNRFISTEPAHPSAGVGGGDGGGLPERMIRHRRGGDAGGPLRLARGEEEGLSQSNKRAEIERVKVLTQRRAETAEKLRQLEQRGQPTPSAATGPPASHPAPAPPASGPSRTVLAADKARQLSALLERKKATVEAALAKCKQRFAEVEKNPAACPAAEKQALLQNIRELGHALRSIADQSRRLTPISPLRRASLASAEGESRSGAGTGHLTPLPDMEVEEDDDDQATSDLFVRPFPAEWVDEEDVKFHFATTTMTTPLLVEFHPQYVKVVFPGKRTAMRAIESSGEWNDTPIGLHLAEPREVGPVHVQEAAATADTGSAKGEDAAGHTAPGAAEPQRMEVDEDDDPDRSWKR